MASKMELTSSDALVIEQILIERIPYGIAVPIDMRVKIDKDMWVDQLVARVHYSLDSMKDEKTESQTSYEKVEATEFLRVIYPDGWWQAFKERWLPVLGTRVKYKIEKKSVPVTIRKTINHTVKHVRICPHGVTAGVSGDRQFAHIAWMKEEKAP